MVGVLEIADSQQKNAHYFVPLSRHEKCDFNVENKKKSLLPPTLVELRRDMLLDLCPQKITQNSKTETIT